METVAQVARIWHDAGVSTIPILPGGTKKPAVSWGEFQVHLPELGQLDHWWGNGQEYGLALIMGNISGNLEMLELEGRACDPASLIAIEEACDQLGCLPQWQQLISTCYTEESPSGGLHFIYRISDHPVPGNEKVARRPASLDELDQNPQDRIKVLAETRGEGGYVIVAPTPGICHPSGRQWFKVRGAYGDLVTMKWQTRVALHQAIRLALDTMPEPAPLVRAPSVAPMGAGAHLWDDWDRSADFPTLLAERGWAPVGRGGWVRPGKDTHDGISATLNHDGTNRLYPFSTSTELEANRFYSPFEFVAHFDHGGDMTAALKAYGIRSEVVTLGDVSYGVKTVDAEVVPERRRHYELTETGNALRLADQDTVSGLFHWVHEEKQFRHWDGVAWAPDHTMALTREVMEMNQRITAEGLSTGSEVLHKWGRSSQSASRVKATETLFKAVKDVTVSAGVFDQDRNLLNLRNGILDLDTGKLLAHDPKYRITRTFGASYDPVATAPTWDAFIETALPDPSIRGYVQRALGASLIGGTDQRSMFILHGPSGTGKSTLFEVMEEIFGDYGLTAPAGAFRSRNDSMTNDLHALRGRRLVTTSETADSTTFNEELIKQLTGRDRVQSRDLYQTNQQWIPEATIWVATNNPPRFNSDDNAIWRRVKLIPMEHVFLGSGEVFGMARRFLFQERDGILNWLLAGLRDFLANGNLEEPEEVTKNVQEFRVLSDSVIRCIMDLTDSGRVIESPEASCRVGEIFILYTTWCKENGERSLGFRRFQNRLVTGMGTRIHISGSTLTGLSRAPNIGVAGTFFGGVT